MINVKLTYPFDWPILKQTPHRSGAWGNCKFHVNQDIQECDFWVVFEGLRKKEETRCPPENILLITAEPPTVKTYHPKFINQFNWVLTCHDFNRKRIIYSQQGLNWMVGGRYIKTSHSWEKDHTKDYDELSLMKEFEKSRLLSIVVSNKNMTKGHRDRQKFIAAAKRHFGSSLDVFGIGFDEIADKWDAIYPYKYHITMENSVCRDYWTEKISDVFLAGSYPFYYGCPNIDEYFSSHSLTCINILDIEESLEKISRIMDENKYEQSKDLILNSRNLILNKYNLMAVIGDFCESNFNPMAKSKKVSLFPESFYQQSKFSLGKIKSLLFR